MPLRCANCGHMNSEGGKFCNSCGDRLKPPTRGRCPECGTLNLPSNIFCDECGARIIPGHAAPDEQAEESSVRGLSLPSREPSEEPRPDWLEQIRSGFGEPEEAVSPDQGAPASAEDGLPDWLAEAALAADDATLIPSEADIEPGEVPDWIQQLRPRELGPAQGPSDAGADELEPADLPEWLQETQAQGAGPAGPTERAGLPSVEEDTFDTGELPDWLREVSGRAAAPAEREPERAEPMPEPREVKAFDTGELPDWLREIAHQEEAPEGDQLVSEPLEGAEPVPAPREVDAFDTGDLPAWLRDIVGEDEAAGEREPEDDETVGEAVSKPEEAQAPEPAGLPEWLRQDELVEEVEPASVPREVDAFDTGDLPGWLRDIVGQDEAAAEREPEAAEPVAESMPELEEVEATAPADLPEWIREAEFPERAPEDEMPEAEAEPEPAEVEEFDTGDLPERVREVEPQAEAPEESEPEPVAADALEPVDLSKWLPEIQLPDRILETESPEELPPADMEAAEIDQSADEVEAEAEPDELLTVVDGAPSDEQEVSDLGDLVDLETGELPAWLQDYALGGEGSDAPGLAPAEPLVPDEEIEEEKPALEERPPERPRVPSAAEASALTDWLGEMARPVEEGATPARAEGGTGPLVPPEVPDWLAAVSEPIEPELPSWLVQDKGAEAEIIPDLAERRAPAGTSLPSWLTDEDVGLQITEEEAAELLDLPQAGPASSELPDWLRMAQRVPGRPESRGPGDRGSFLADLEAIDLAAVSSVEPGDGTDVITGLELAQAEIPDWLEALRPLPPRDGLAKPTPEELEPVEKGGFLDGIRGALGVQSQVLIAPERRAISVFEATEQQQAHAQILEQIVHAGAAPVPEVVQKSRPKAWVEQTIIPILLLAAILLPAWITNPLQGLIGEEARSEQVLGTYDLLDNTLSSGSALAVVAFDYTPAEAAELNPVSAVLLRHLMERGAYIVALTTAPTGAEIAQTMLEETAGDRVYGDDYLNLGYIPGGAAGLQLLANDPWSLFPGADYPNRFRAGRAAPAADGLGDSLANADILMVISADRDDLVAWIEQVGRLDEMQGVTMVAGTSASLAPWVQPYTSSRLDGVVSGIPGAAQYEQRLDLELSTQSAGSAVYLRDGQLVGLGVSIVVIAIGLLWGVGQGLVRGRQRDG